MRIAKMLKGAGFIAFMILSGFLVGQGAGIKNSILKPSTEILNNNTPDDGHYYSLMDTVLYRDFESSSGAFMAEHDWQWGIPTNPNGPRGAHSGIKVWAVGLTANYSVGPLVSSLVAPSTTLGDSSILSFWHWYSTEDQWDAYDGGNLKISTDSGDTWSLITPENGYDGTLSALYGNPMGGQPVFFGRSNGWVCDSFDLSGYSGATVQIKFDFGSDETYALTGWFVDDYLISNITAQSAEEEAPGLPKPLSLSQNYPNPFNTQTMIRYGLQKQSAVTINIFDMLGRKLETFNEGVKPAGEYQVVWDASKRASGVYFYKITVGNQEETRRMTLRK